MCLLIMGMPCLGDPSHKAVASDACFLAQRSSKRHEIARFPCGDGRQGVLPFRHKPPRGRQAHPNGWLAACGWLPARL